MYLFYRILLLIFPLFLLRIPVQYKYLVISSDRGLIHDNHSVSQLLNVVIIGVCIREGQIVLVCVAGVH